MAAKINENSEVTIPVRNLVALLGGTAVAVMGYFNITERLTFLEHDEQINKIAIDLNSEFRIKWPRGEIGSLPDDAEQNMRLNYIENKIQELEKIIKDGE